MSAFINKIIPLVFASLFLIQSCSTIKYIPTQEQTIYTYKDTTIIKDSIVITPIERIVDVVPQYDTLKLSTSLAESISYVDTSLHILRGSIANKTAITEHIIYKDKIVYRDSTVVQEVPVEVQVEKKYIPKWVWLSLGLNLLIIIAIAIKLYLKFK